MRTALQQIQKQVGPGPFNQMFEIANELDLDMQDQMYALIRQQTDRIDALERVVASLLTGTATGLIVDVRR